MYFTTAELSSANSAANTDYLTQEEKDIFLYSNLARMYPQKFYQLFKDFAISEGRSADLAGNKYYSSLAKELKSRDAQPTIYPDEVMYDLARCWAEESGEKGLVGHDRESCPRGYAGENCAYGYATGLEIVMQLLIDEGIEDYGHRENLLYPDWRGMGAAIRTHKDYRFCAVQNFARTNDELRAREESIRIEKEARENEKAKLLALRQDQFKAAMAQWSKEEMRSADVTRTLSYLNELEKDLYFYTNLMRLYPQKFKALFWDEGPFFDKLLPELRTGIHRESQYLAVSKWLIRSSADVAFIPAKEHVEVLRCVIDRYLSGKTEYRSCFDFTGAWRFQTFYSESNFNDVMNILLNPKDFNDILVHGATVALQPGNPSIKVFVTPN